MALPSLGVPEFLLILVIVVMIFGVGKLPEIGGAVGRGIREFRRASTEYDETPKAPDSTGPLPAVVRCPQCGVESGATHDFCTRCGARLHEALTNSPYVSPASSQELANHH